MCHLKMHVSLCESKSVCVCLCVRERVRVCVAANRRIHSVV